MSSGLRRLTAAERDTVSSPILARTLHELVAALDDEANRGSVQLRLAVLAGRLDRLSIEGDAPLVQLMIALDCLRIEPVAVRRHIEWLARLSTNAPDASDAGGVAAILENLLARAALGRTFPIRCGPSAASEDLAHAAVQQDTANARLDGLPIAIAPLRRQLRWLLAHEGGVEADGLISLVEALLDRAELQER
jgi:hypothetical protein